MADRPNPLSNPNNDDCHAASLAILRQALDTLKFGQIVLTVHEGKVVQLDVTEKQRFTGN